MLHDEMLYKERLLLMNSIPNSFFCKEDWEILIIKKLFHIEWEFFFATLNKHIIFKI